MQVARVCSLVLVIITCLSLSVILLAYKLYMQQWVSPTISESDRNMRKPDSRGVSRPPVTASSGNETENNRTNIISIPVVSGVVTASDSQDASPSVLHNPVVNVRWKTGGYVAAVSFFDQQTSAMGRILSLQCWAGGLGMSVVEPFMQESMPGLPITKGDWTKAQPRFRDMFNLDHWHNALVSPRGYAPLVSWDDFLHNAPRSVILVDLKLGANHIGGPCGERLRRFEARSSSFFKNYNFTIISSTCIDLFQSRTVFTGQQFKVRVFGKRPVFDNVTVVFSQWPGITKVRALIPIPKSPCLHYPLRLQSIDAALPSPRVTKDALQYIERHLHNRSYVTVMIRFEYWIGKLNATQCLDRLTAQVKELLRSANVSEIYVTADIGTLGSVVMQNRNKTVGHFVHFLRQIHENSSLTMEAWENTFLSVASWSSPGYVALMQTEVAVRGKCIRMLGGGGFQEHALARYKELHSSNQCYKVETRCKESAAVSNPNQNFMSVLACLLVAVFSQQ